MRNSKFSLQAAMVPGSPDFETLPISVSQDLGTAGLSCNLGLPKLLANPVIPNQARPE
jgi:hypothetical protein